MTKDEFNQTTRLQRAVKMHTVPKEKWTVLVQRTVLGVVFTGMGMAGAVLFGWPMYVDIGLVLFGATIWSTQVVKGALLALIGPFKAWKRVAGKDVEDDA